MNENSFEQTTSKDAVKNRKESIFDFLKFIFIVAAIVLPIRLWVAQPFLVSGASMEPTYNDGDYLIVDEFTYHLRDPKKNEVIVFRYPNDPSKFFIKRIAALPNETATMIDGKEIQIKDKEYFVTGDNSDKSSDSRYWGPVAEKFIIGRSFVRLWPLNKIGLFPGY
ncbi:MAG: signal peptidase I [Candidatus Pacebacteria bacterium]|nr:signal peptidase I [Candidatus Paceibacterota bacterium]NUQ57127.1 signal peptidase I [Candidatus Paceibacter sp.]